MRVSTSLIFNSGTSGIQNRQYDLYKTMNQLATGRRIQTPEDDPIGAAQSLEVTQSKEVNKQFLDNQATATTKLNFVDATLGNVDEELLSIYEKAIQGGNVTYSPAQRGMVAAELKQRMSSLVGLANAQDGTGLYIFSGFKSNTAPFQVNNGSAPPPYTGGTQPYALGNATAVAYIGDSGNETLQVSASRVMATGENGVDVFMQVKDAQGNVTGRSMFDSLQNLIDQLDPSSGVPFNTASYNQAVADISSTISHVSTVRASVGARLQSLESMSLAASDADFQYASRLSDLQDLDYTDAISKLSRYQMQLEAAQQSFKTTSQLSLFNIL